MKAKTLLQLFLTLLFASVVFGNDLNERFLEAARSGEVEAVKKLLDEGADVNARYRYESTALFFAADQGNVELAKLLIERGVDINVKDTFYNATALAWAGMNNHVEIAILLVENGIDGSEGALENGAAQGEMRLVKAVLENNENIAQKALDRALKNALRGKHDEVVKTLRAAGAKETDAAENAKTLPTEILQQYVGSYEDERATRAKIELNNGNLTISFDGSGNPLKLLAIAQDTMRYADFEGFVFSFSVENKKAKAFTLVSSSRTMNFKRAAEKPSEEANVADAEALIDDGNRPEVTEPKNWPGFRGEGASGVADGQHPPTRWNVETGENITWKTPIPGLSVAGPIVWDDRIYVTTAISSDTSAGLRIGLYGDVAPDKDVSPHVWKVYALDKNSGEILWERTAHEGVPQVKRHTKSAQNNSTPVTNGEYIVVLFGAEGLYCYKKNGDLAWKNDVGRLDSGWFYNPDYEWGHGSSPIIYKDMVILQADIQKNSFIAAYRLKDGKEVWRTNRDEIPSWASPTVVETEKGAELVTNATNHIMGYDPMTGKELWRMKGNSEIATPTPFIANDLIYVTSGYRPIQPIYAIRPGSRGDISLAEDETSNEAIVWSTQRGGPYLPTPIVYDKHLYVCANNGVMTCYNAMTGERVYRQRTGARGAGYAFTASPVAADGKLYLSSEDGIVYVIKAGETFKRLAKNDMDDTIMATPAISDGMIFIRTQKHIYGIGGKQRLP